LRFFREPIYPDTFEFEKDYFKMGGKYGRVIFLREYAAYFVLFYCILK